MYVLAVKDAKELEIYVQGEASYDESMQASILCTRQKQDVSFHFLASIRH